MLSKIKNKVRQNDSRLEDLHQLQEDQIALVQLYKMFPDALFLPLTTWSISPREIVHACNEIVINNRRNIVEFGAGFSTICIAQLLRLHGLQATFIIVEESAEWAAEMQKILEGLGLSSNAAIVTAPVAPVKLPIALTGQTKWYDSEALDKAFENISGIDLVIVDGPTGATSKYARYSAIPYLKEKLSPDFVIFADDTQRPDEKDMVTEWHRILQSGWSIYKRYTCLFSIQKRDATPYGVKFRK